MGKYLLINNSNFEDNAIEKVSIYDDWLNKLNPSKTQKDAYIYYSDGHITNVVDPTFIVLFYRMEANKMYKIIGDTPPEMSTTTYGIWAIYDENNNVLQVGPTARGMQDGTVLHFNDIITGINNAYFALNYIYTPDGGLSPQGTQGTMCFYEIQ